MNQLFYKTVAIFSVFLSLPSYSMKKFSPLGNQRISTQQLSLPVAGIGTCGIKESSSITHALRKFKFPVVDTAKVYGNENIIGQAIKESGRDPKEIFVITKLAEDHLKNETTLEEAVKDSTTKIGKIPDLFLIHAPYGNIAMLQRIKDLMRLKQEGRITQWGVSNFDVEHIQFLLKNHLKPALNQVEIHPSFQRRSLIKWCQENNILVQAYRPINQGKSLEIDTIKKLAAHYFTSEAQIIYSWLAQFNIGLLTKVSAKAHLQEYAECELIDFSNQELQMIEALDEGQKGRTCTRGGWFVPFTHEIEKTWASESKV